VVAADPAAAQQSVVRVTGGVLKLEALKASWPDYDYRTGLDGGLLSLLVEEGQWVKERGLIKNVDPTEALFRGYIDAAPLKALAPARVTLP
jgi:NitT/TauT family transport system substrate-binding protein